MASLLTRRPHARTAAAVLGLALFAAAARAQSAPVRIDPAWLRADSATRLVEFTLLAGMNGLNGGMNFNGVTGGALTLTVPPGWSVVLHFRNEDQNLPHSAVVIRAVASVPTSAGPAAIEHAATHKLEQGMGSQTHEDVRFTAEHAGPYLIYCAVPGHGAAGMWIRLDIDPLATRPSVTHTHPKGG